MKKMFLILAALVAGVAVTPRPAEAHHGWAEFDENSEVKFDGIVKDFHFTNPHCVVDFDVKDDKGQTHRWQGEFASPPELARKGWTAASLQPGDKIIISGHPAKNAVPAIHVSGIHFADGRELKLYNGR